MTQFEKANEYGVERLKSSVESKNETSSEESSVESSDENTYLLSTIFTLAMNENMPLNQIINSKDVSNKQVCKYLDWQVSN